jgi:hypothetical protein
MAPRELLAFDGRWTVRIACNRCDGTVSPCKPVPMQTPGFALSVPDALSLAIRNFKLEGR